MSAQYTNDYLLDKKVKIFQPVDGYRASADAVMLSAAVSNKLQSARILDVGSGTGAVSLCLAQRLQNHNVEIIGAEIQPLLAELANLSARENGFDFLQYYRADIRQKLDKNIFRPCSFDVVISNPPYSDHDMPSPQKSKATAHNLAEIHLSDWLAFCLKMAKPFGKIYMVNRAEALPHICTALQNKAGGLTVWPIYSKPNQDAKRIIVCAQKDSKAPCCIKTPFVVHNESGDYTPQAQKVLREGLCFDDL